MNADLKVSLRTDAIRAYYASNEETLDAPQSTHRPFEKPSGRPICDSFFHGVKK